MIFVRYLSVVGLQQLLLNAGREISIMSWRSNMSESMSVAIIVPTKNSERTLEACLRSVKSQRYPCTLIVVDNHSDDRTLEIAKELADMVLISGPERSVQRNIGASVVDAEVVGFIDSDMILSTAVVGEAVGAIQSGAVSVVVPERSIGDGFWAEVRAFERQFYQDSDAIEAPRFFLQNIFNQVGGFDDQMTGAEDWDLGIRVDQFGMRARIKAEIDHDEGHVYYLDACRKKAYYAPGIAYFIRKYKGRGLTQISSRPWLLKPKSLMNLYGIGLLALKLGEALAVILVLSKRRVVTTSGIKTR